MIERSVGRRARAAENVASDVAILQNLLTTLSELLERPEYGTNGVDGKISGNEEDSATVRAIEAFQFANQLAVDGLVGADGETIRLIRMQLELVIGSVNQNNPNVAGQTYFPFPVLPSPRWSTGPRAFGARRDGGSRAHAGCDLYFKHGTWIHAMADGRVIRGPYPFYSHTFALEIDHGDFVARYGEIRPVTVVSEGDTVRAGQRIAMVGHLIGINVESDMLHLELYDGSGSGPLTVDQSRSSLTTKGVPYNRRQDLIDPTQKLDTLSRNLPAAFQAVTRASVGRPRHEEQLTRQVNEAGVELVKEFEGFYSEAYTCPAGVWTIGYGHTEGVRPGQTIGKAEADVLLRRDLAAAGAKVQQLISVSLKENQFAALASFTFNAGAGALEESTLRRKLNQGNFDAVPAEMARWVKATVNGVKKSLPGLVRRRAAEGVLWLKPESGDDQELGMPQIVGSS